MRPTPEQQRVIEAASRGENIRVKAFAGAGKTTTLRLAAGALASRRGIYLAFNRTIAEEAREKMPPHIDSRTAHSLAFRSVVRADLRYTRKFQATGGNLGMRALRERLRIEPAYGFTAAQVAGLVLSTLRKFLYSLDPEVLPTHVPRQAVILAELRGGKAAAKALVRYVTTLAQTTWNRMRDPDDDFPLTHDGYFALWARNREELPQADFILLDEAQDSNPPLIAKLTDFAEAGGQVILVGDPNQQIYGWRGALNAMHRFPYPEYPLTHSFRFGPEIAAVAQAVLKALREPHPIVGAGPRGAAYSYEPPALKCCPLRGAAVLGRTNAALISAFLEFARAGYSPSINGGSGELVRLLEDLERLIEGSSPGPNRPLAGFRSLDELEEFAKAASEPGILTLLDLYGDRKKLDFLRQTRRALKDSPHEGDVLLSTVHRAKGGEWDAVILLDDFYPPPARKLAALRELEGPTREELAILYVALTRPRRELYVPSTLAEAIVDYDGMKPRAPLADQATPNAPSR